MARPTKYNTALVEKAQHYLDNYEEYDEVINTVVKPETYGEDFFK